jgi:hypothetical protein
MIVESHGGMILTGKTKELKEKPLPVPLLSPQIPASMVRGWQITV